MSLTEFIRAMPKVELHVHLQGATRPETLLMLAQRNGIALPTESVEGLRDWYRFRDFDHFISIYDVICECFCSAEDIEQAAREFLQGQAAQQIVYTELTYTPNRRMPFELQLEAINRARAWAESQYGIGCGLVIDIPMEVSADEGMMIADWAISGIGRGVVGFGLGGGEGVEVNRRHRAAFDRARAAGLASVPHAGETSGAPTVWSAIDDLGARRLGHGVRCLEDPALVAELQRRGTVLEVCPTSNVLLGVASSLEQHPLPHLIAAGLTVTINTDDPPMFNTTLNEEYCRCAAAFGWDRAMIEGLVLNAARAVLLPDGAKARLIERVQRGFTDLKLSGNPLTEGV